MSLLNSLWKSLRTRNYMRFLEKKERIPGFRKVLNILSKKRLIFTVSNGRSGTGYLAEVLGRLSAVDAYHESEPDFVRCLRDATSDLKVALAFLVRQKLPFISSLEKDIYCETSHLFNKAFIFPLYDLGVKFELIMLMRDRRKIAQSLYELGTIPGRNSKALLYYLKPDDPVVFLRIEDWKRLSDYQLCYWHVLETEKRMEEFSSLVPSYFVNIDDILSMDGVLKLCQLLSLPVSSKDIVSLRSVVGKKINSKSSQKVRSLFKDYTERELEEQEREVEEIVRFKGINYEDFRMCYSEK